MYPFALYKLPSIDSKVEKYIGKNGFDCHFSKFYAQPLLENGFNIYIHKTKDSMDFVNKPNFKGKNFYYVVNPFEHVISNNDKSEKNDINTGSKLYFDLDKDSVGITSRAFYKLWEILMILDPFSKSSICTAHLAEAPGSFVQATMFYREKFYKSSNDEHYTISLEDNKGPTFKQEFRKNYSKVKIYDQDGGDLTSIKSIEGFSKFSKKADFITADGGFEWINENMQEQEAFRLILGEIICALKIQKNGGTFVLKLFETYTNITIKFMLIIATLYEETYIYKPYTSRPSNSERYLICKHFKGVDDKLLDKLTNLLTEMNMGHDNGLELADFLSDIVIPHDFKNVINYSSLQLSNVQFEYINKMLTFVNSGNYYGDQYHKYLEDQQNANQYWLSLFFPLDKSDYITVRRIITEELNKSDKILQNKFNEYNKLIIN